MWTEKWPISLAARSKACVCGRSLAEGCGFESRRGHGYLSVMNIMCCTDSGLCYGQIPCPEESYLVRVCVYVCVCVCVRERARVRVPFSVIR